MRPMQTLLLLVGVVVLASATVRLLLMRRREVQALQGLAVANRLNFSREDIIGVHERYQRLEMIRRGHSRCASNVLYGTSPAGLVSVCCYTYELGLGANAQRHGWWIAVVETGRSGGSWRAVRAAEGEAEDSVVKVSGFWVAAEEPVALEKVKDEAVAAVLRSSPADLHWEISGPLVAAAVPLHDDVHAAERVLKAAMRMAQALNQA